MPKLCFLLGDQISKSLTALKKINKDNDLVFLCEVMEEATYVNHHPKKIAFLFSAMRHFAKDLTKDGYHVRYVTLDEPHNLGSLEKELYRVIEEENITSVVLTEPGEWRVLQKFLLLKQALTIPVTLHADNRFLSSISEFKNWLKNKKHLRMEFFYRMMRKKYSILMKNEEIPIGRKWNFDDLNRKRASTDLHFPPRLTHNHDEITLKVLALVKEKFSHHFGRLDNFNMAVTREEALEEAHFFINQCLPQFGDYQDAMLKQEVHLFHSRLSCYLNAGLLLPLELCKMAEQAYLKNAVAINSAEGFIRQILGWREYVRGIYWSFMPDYANLNYFNATRSLPDFFWGKPTDMFCLKEVVKQTGDEAYSHHIQRLMITGNFALLAGLDPKEVCKWYLEVYADAYEWVELPNTLGMALYADGGVIASKPYAASGKYINRMSNFCQSCIYDPKEVTGEKACPFNSLYWNFLDKNRNKLDNNPRLRYVYMHLDKMPGNKKEEIFQKAQTFLKQLD
ncbi:cryptochrome/photolyase family protein [Legionella brunensis]|uniref:Deoxyribodipyrimidine photolyase-related protein n=1 Tax=Legionella brunensis TaxID=29422 RepID=A0A0W0SKP6_9GAMM|nr:cryptochrome/photolyase family protein [Legionella brunensis]KTC83825.1 Deoxyribodipyrimidine photolyase-related protein [Legionella brunensis]